MKKIVLGTIIGAVLLAPSVMKADISVADEGGFEASVSADIVTSYVWRGQQLGGASIQPGMSIGYKGLALEAWGSTSIEDRWAREVDLTLSYSICGITVGATDYWFSLTGDGLDAKYFHYGAHNPYNSHVYEAHLGYEGSHFGVDWYTNFAGCDGLNKKGKRAYSSYVVLSTNFSGAGLDWEAHVGASPYCTSFYDASGFAVTEVAIKAAKTVTISDIVTFPAWVQLAVNPRSENVFLVAGLSF